MLSPGDIIDSRYEVIAPLAEGGMGAIFRARRILLGDEVAIKVVRGDAADEVARERFLRESRVAARLRHPAIVSILDFDIPAEGPSYLVMELLSGPSLREELDARGRFGVADVCRIIPEVCAALELTHAHGIVHRDIKPANIVRHDYRNAETVYKLVDFGIANLRQTNESRRLTGAHQFLGTVAYAAPEQLTVGEGDARSDIYSLAAVVFEMLTGRAPFIGDVMAIVSAQMSKTPPRVRSIRPEVPEAIDLTIARCLAKAPEERIQSAAEFGAAFSSAAPERRSRPRSSPVTDGETPTVVGLPVRALDSIYEIGDSLGRGRLGSEVFRGVHRALGHPVAIRILRADAHPNWSGARERFLREARALQIAHPSIIQVRDYGEEPGLVYLITDYIPGDSLRRVLNGGGLPWYRLRLLLTQLLEAARVLHRRDILLCGLHPEIMRVRPPDSVDPDASDAGERLMISTAGIWKAQDLLATLNERTLRGMGLEDVELRYVAPEVFTGGGVDVRSDIFTLGVLAYEMATGTPPYDGATMAELLGKMLAGSPADPRSLGSDVPPHAAAAILRALRPAPGERFEKAKEFTAEIATPQPQNSGLA